MTKSHQNNKQLYAEYREKCKQSLLFTLVYFWDTIVRDELKYNWHMGIVCSELEKVGKNIIARKDKEYDLIINIPPGTTKSTIATVVFPVWLWMNDPSIRIISNSYSSAISIEHSMRSRDIVESVKFKRLFPHIAIRGDKAGKQHYENIHGGSRYAVSTGGSVTGSHAHVIINDDPQNPAQAESEVGRIQANDHTKTLATRKVDKAKTPTILIMQRLHEQDVTGYLLNKKEDNIRHIKLPAEITDKTKPIPNELAKYYTNNLLDEIRLGAEVIDEMKVDLGTRGYNGQFLQNPTAEEGDIIKKEWFRVISLADFNRLRSKNETVHFYVDSAYTSSNDNDPTGILAACAINNVLYVTNRIKVRKEFPELIRFIPSWVAQNGYNSYSTVRIEPKANGLSIIQTMKRSTSVNVTQTPSPRDDKKTRLTAISPKIECGRVVLVEGNWNQEFIDEVSGFPNAAHDEDVDLLVYAVNHQLTDRKNEISGDILWM